jgi:hypothetical protein
MGPSKKKIYIYQMGKNEHETSTYHSTSWAW